jgi:hypothetical protein
MTGLSACGGVIATLNSFMGEKDMEDRKIVANASPIFRNLTADDPEPETTEIESLCMNCGENVNM